MPHPVNNLKIVVFGSLLTLGAFAAAQSALAGDYRSCDGDYCHVVCDRDGDHCYRIQERGDDWQNWRSDDYDRYHDWDRNNDWDRDYHRMHDVCDSDGDRCYLSESDYWNYREYYRIHGYHWGD